MRRSIPVVLGLAALLGGCAMPSIAMPTMPSVPGWVPFFGKKAEDPPARAKRVEPPPSDTAAATSATSATAALKAEPDETVVDRVIAIVNNDAITLAELQESVAVYRQETRGQPGTASDDDLAKQFLGRLIDNRLQLQEAERERIVVEETEVAEELAERVKKFKVGTLEEFEKLVAAQGLNIDAIKKRLRESIMVSKVVRRKVALRVSVTEQEITAYLDANRAKLETGLAYHARHILLQAEGGESDVAWESARIKTELIRTQLLAGADFAELARQHSRDASARDGGDLGTLKRGELAQEIEVEILKLNVGDISRPYRSPLGYHIFRLELKETLEGEGLARARQQIRDILFREKFEARQNAWLKEIKQRAIIEVRL